jgi:hypothetical protein
LSKNEDARNKATEERDHLSLFVLLCFFLFFYPFYMYFFKDSEAERHNGIDIYLTANLFNIEIESSSWTRKQ